MRRHSCAVLFATVVHGCADGPQMPPPMHEPLLASAMPEPVYELELIDATLGGVLTVGTAINARGWVAGYSRLAVGRHAVLWRDGELESLGTLGGPSSAVQWPGINDSGTVVGISFLADEDPNNATWSCEAFLGASDRICRGFYWTADGRMQQLEPLGGYNSFATQVNNRGQIVGWAETSFEDPTCRAPQKLGFHAVLWEPKNARKQALPPLPGDAASSATAINERGQVVGISGKCFVAVGDSSARAAVLWENGVPRELPNLGTGTWNTPMDINDRGHVVGFGNTGDDARGNPVLSAFLWTGGTTVTPLAIAGDDSSLGYGINARGQAVGTSCRGPACRAFLYERGRVHDLNVLVRDDEGAVLVAARHINDAGVIVGNATRGDSVKLFIARPKGHNGPGN